MQVPRSTGIMQDFEPMDVDASGSSTSKMDISCNDIDLSILKKEKEDTPPPENETSNLSLIKDFFKKENDSHSVLTISGSPRISQMEEMPPVERPNYTKTNKFRIRLERRQNNAKKLLLSNLKISAYIISLVALVIAMIVYQIGHRCMEELDVISIEEKLSKNLYGQDDTITSILKALNDIANNKLLVFYGSTGVGKTHATSMILENIRYSSNVYHFTMPSFIDGFETEYLFGLTVCNKSFIVVDDLTIDDTSIMHHLGKIFYKSKDLEKRLTIILVYNCDIVSKGFVKKCNENFTRSLNDTLRGIPAEIHLIKFNKLTLDHLIQCIVRELAVKQVPLDDALLAEILMHFDVEQDGCKSVYSKINFLTDG